MKKINVLLQHLCKCFSIILFSIQFHIKLAVHRKIISIMMIIILSLLLGVLLPYTPDFFQKASTGFPHTLPN